MVNFHSCYCMSFCITTYFSVLTVKLQMVLPEYFLFKEKKIDKKCSISRAPFQTGETLAESDCRDSVFFKGECCWSLDFVFPVSAFQHVSSSTFVSFTSSLFPVLFKQSSYIPFENLCLFSSILFVC